jgi:hypothetical protein
MSTTAPNSAKTISGNAYNNTNGGTIKTNGQPAGYPNSNTVVYAANNAATSGLTGTDTELSNGGQMVFAQGQVRKRYTWVDRTAVV